jgi:hypothetical protein
LLRLFAPLESPEALAELSEAKSHASERLVIEDC